MSEVNNLKDAAEFLKDHCKDSKQTKKMLSSHNTNTISTNLDFDATSGERFDPNRHLNKTIKYENQSMSDFWIENLRQMFDKDYSSATCTETYSDRRAIKSDIDATHENLRDHPG